MAKLLNNTHTYKKNDVELFCCCSKKTSWQFEKTKRQQLQKIKLWTKISFFFFIENLQKLVINHEETTLISIIFFSKFLKIMNLLFFIFSKQLNFYVLTFSFFSHVHTHTHSLGIFRASHLIYKLLRKTCIESLFLWLKYVRFLLFCY